MKIRKTSITERMILYYVLLSAAAITLIGAIFFYIARDALMDRTFDQLTSVRVVKKRQIESFFRDRINDLKLFSKMPEIKNRFAELDKHHPTSAIKSQADRYDILNAFIDNNQYFDAIMIENATRTSSLIIKDQSIDTEMFEALSYKGIDNDILFGLKKGLSVYEKPSIFKDNDEMPYLLFVSEVRNNSQILGYCSLILSFQSINKIMLENNQENGLGNTGESYLVGSDRLMRSKSRFKDTSIYKVIVNSEGVNEAFLGKAATSVFIDYNGNLVLSSYEKIDIPGLEWVILSEIDLAEAEIPVIEFRNYIILIIAIISITTFFVTYLISKRITNPIKKLTDAATRIGEGNFDEAIQINTNDELQKLSETFNIMSKQLKSKEKELQQEKTKRISVVMDALENERERLSRDLHDSLGQSLIALKLKLENIEPDYISKDNSILEEAKTDIDSIIHDIRNMSNDLMPSVLKEFGLTTAIRNMCHELSTLLNFDIDLFVDIKDIKISQKESIYIYRIIQEGLSNIIKHANANSAGIELNSTNDIIEIIMQDDGIGFNLEGSYSTNGNGLYYMKERVNLLNGSLKINSELNNGTKITITIKKDKNEHNKDNIS
jgi:two-component system NarL family sensor kinase